MGYYVFVLGSVSIILSNNVQATISMTYRVRACYLGMCLAAVCGLLSSLAGCGSGAGNSNSGPPGDFSISASPVTLALAAGGSQTVTVSAAAINTFSASISVSVSGLPAGVTANPATFNLAPGSQQETTLTVGTPEQPVTATVTFQGTSGSLSHAAKLSLAIVTPASGIHPPIRPRYLRTNSFYDPNTLQYAPPHFTFYDSVHRQFFVSNPFMNEIDVFDADQEIQTARIPVSFPWGLDVSPNNGSLYVGTLIGDIYQIDTATYEVLNRYASASIGPAGFGATTALVLSDGRLALQGGIGEGAALGVDGYGISAVWDPATNALDTGGNAGVCSVRNEGAFALSGDRTRILVASVDESGGGQPVCSYDPMAKIATYGVFPFATFVRQIVPTPDGSRFFLTSAGAGVGVFDAKTVQLLGQITGTGDGIPNGADSGVISRDGKTLYLSNELAGKVGAFDTTSLAQTGWVPGFIVIDSQASIALSAIDETGLIVGPIGHGVGFIDASQRTSTLPTLIDPGFAIPPTGPKAGDTVLTNFAVGDVQDAALLNQIYVGNVPGPFATFNVVPGQINEAQVSAPVSSLAGAVDLALLLSDGALGLVPEGFSYGPTILEVTPNGATAEGGQTGVIIGYGFGDSLSDIQVTVGGASAPVIALYNAPPIVPFPFPANSLQFTVPPGTAGGAVDVTVTTPSGSATAAGAFHYSAAAESYPVTANLQSGIYDPTRDLYYFADRAQIQVLSRSARTWLSPIPLPGTSDKTQLLAISLSPDGTKLAVSDFGGQAIYVLNPDNPASAKPYPMSLDTDGSAALMAPGGLAITDNGMVYFDARDIGGTGTPLFHKLNTVKGSIIDLGELQSGGPGDEFNRVLLSPDGSRVYSSVSGDVTVGFWLETANDQIHFAGTDFFGSSQDLAVSGDGSTIDVDGLFTDSSLGPQTQVVYIDWETWFPFSVLGQKLNQEGSVLFKPLTDGIDLLARNTGRLLYRIQISDGPAEIYDALVVAKEQNTLAVISATTVSFVDLSTLPIPANVAQPFANRIRSKKLVLPGGQHAMPTKPNLSHVWIDRILRPKLRRKPDQSVRPTGVGASR
jgi:IPT/TIG domain